MQVAAYALITVFLGVLLRELGFRGSKLILLLGTVSVIGAAALSAGSLFSMLGGVGENIFRNCNCEESIRKRY